MVTNSFVFIPSIALPNCCNLRSNYQYKSSLNYKVNENKLHLEDDWNYLFCVDTLHFNP